MRTVLIWTIHVLIACDLSGCCCGTRCSSSNACPAEQLQSASSQAADIKTAVPADYSGSDND